MACPFLSHTAAAAVGAALYAGVDKKVNERHKWMTADQVPFNSMQGKTVLITGGNSGIGFESAKILAIEAGADVVICGRNQKRVNEAVEKIEALLAECKNSVVHDAQTGKTKPTTCGRIQGMHMDLASFASVEKFSAEFLQKFDRLDVLVHNAGMMIFPEEETQAKKFRTQDGFERFTQINHLGSFLLTKLLWPLLVKTGSSPVVSSSPSGEEEDHGVEGNSTSSSAAAARVVLVSSLAQWGVGRNGVDFSEAAWKKAKVGSGSGTSTSAPDSDIREYNGYDSSKLMNVLFMRKLAQLIDKANAEPEAALLNKRSKRVNVIATAMHPGGTFTNLARHGPALLEKSLEKTFMPAEQGCLGEVLCSADGNVKNGSYYGPDFWLVGYPVDVSGSKMHNVAGWAKDQESMDTLWARSEEAVLGAGEKFEIC